MEIWRRYYNDVRPHSAHDGTSPAVYRRGLRSQAPPAPSENTAMMG
ncbi:MAG: hypothetical protein DWQ36_06440 [Acidobacteria bacterium]|nr:MAG: hypothetical protein DWQ30_19445 [Acidobacteriota bacterium]REK09696.1 MAG: hypothetical protein DWQ36_06440 [Acidobacteriota bacterium]